MELDGLLARIATYRNRYGRDFDFREPHLLITIKRLVTQLDQLERKRLELDDEIARTASTVRKMIEAIEFEVEAAIAEVTQAQVEMWSPSPVVGYRAWAITSDGMQGVRTLWARPTLTARCPSPFGDDPDDVPHTDDRCGRLGCGIYATKDVPSLLDSELGSSLSGSFAVGRVELTGKVVEHEFGYRAATATVTRVIAFHDGRRLWAAEPEPIGRLFADPVTTMTQATRFTEDCRTATLIAFEEGETWTSERRSA